MLNDLQLHLLVCAECGRRLWPREDGRGWRAYLACDEPAEIVVCCPACAEREFGER